ncbi:MAG TPA: ABC transporter permease subunit [Phycisphaerales bacterium]|nr:ABC transporter permease subunit [Phycisphaerales bacterium]
MMALTKLELDVDGLAAPGAARNVLTIAGRELREAVRSRWFLLYTVAFAALGLGISYVSAAGAGGAGLAGFGRTTAGLINLVLLVSPLMALTAGAGSIAGDRERGMLSYLLSQPVTRTELMFGKYLGLAGALLACLCLGLGTCAAVLALKGEATRPASIVWLAGLAFALSMSMLSVGMLISVLARKASVAVGTAIFAWLTLVFVTDLGLMAGTMALKLRIEQLFTLSLVNPLQVFKMWSLHAVDATLDVLGPAGLYAAEEYGSRLHAIFGGCLGAWIVLPLVVSAVIFSRRSPL